MNVHLSRGREEHYRSKLRALAAADLPPSPSTAPNLRHPSSSPRPLFVDKQSLIPRVVGLSELSGAPAPVPERAATAAHTVLVPAPAPVPSAYVPPRALSARAHSPLRISSVPYGAILNIRRSS